MAHVLGFDRGQSLEEDAADELFYEAIETVDVDARGELLRRTLQANPRHIDALVELARMIRSDRSLAILHKAVEFGEEDLQDELRDDVGHFWGLHHTRPFMRAKKDLADCCLAMGDIAKATAEFEDLLRLNPNDNQGARWMLMEVYCRTNRLDDAQRLLEEYPDEGMPFLPFTGLLIHFQQDGDSPELRKELHEQALRNPHIIPRLLDPNLIDHEPSPTFTMASPEEADLYCQQFLSAWRSTPGAITWLRAVAFSLPEMLDDLDSTDSGEVPPDFDIKSEIQNLRAKVKKLPLSGETWVCDASHLTQDEKEGWLLTVIEDPAPQIVSLEPGMDPLGTDTVFYGLLSTMLAPEEGGPRRPTVIQFVDFKLHRSLITRLKRLEIDTELLDERPQALEVAKRAASLHEQNVEINLDDVQQTPLTTATWEVDWRQLDQWVPNEETGAPVQPWMILVAHEDGLILAQLVSSEPFDAQAIKSVLGQAILTPLVGSPSRPATIHIPSAEHQLDSQLAAQDLGLKCVVGPCTLVDQFFENLSQHMEESGGAPPAMTTLPGLTHEALGDFYESAAEYYQSRLWTSTLPETLIEVHCKELIRGRWYAVIMGQMGEEIGILFFDDRKTVKSIFASDPAAPEEVSHELRGISISFNEQQLVHPRDVAAAEQFGWPVVAPEAWPVGCFIADNTMHPLDLSQLRFLSAAIRAVVKQLQSPNASLVTPVALHDGTVKVATKIE